MALATYRVVAAGVTFAANKSMLSIYNGSGSGKIVKVWRIWLLNNQTASVTGVVTTMGIYTISASSGGTSVTPVKHDTNDASPPAQITFAHGTTDTLVSLLLPFLWSNDEPATGTGTWDEFECLPALAEIWNSGYGEDDVKPITLREGQGVCVRHTGSTTVGNVDVIMEITIE